MSTENLAMENRETTHRTETNGLFEGNQVKKEVIGLFVEYFCRKEPIYLKNLISDLEREIIVKALQTTRGNQRAAARILGIKYTTLNVKVKKYGIWFQKKLVF